MACGGGCGGKRRTKSMVGNQGVAIPAGQQQTYSPVDVDSMPLTKDGLVLAQYVGGQGRGSHYYEGVATRRQYKVLYGQYVYANEQDTKLAEQFNSKSLLIKVVRSEPAAAAPVRVQAAVSKPVEAEPLAVTRTAVRKPMAAPPESEEPKKVDNQRATKVVPEEVPDIKHMTVRAVQELDLSPAMAKKLLAVEKAGLNRKQVVAFLEKSVS